MVSVAFVISMYVIVLRDKAVWNVKRGSGGGKEQALKYDEKGDRVNPSQVKFALRKYLIASKINLESRFTTSLPPLRPPMFVFDKVSRRKAAIRDRDPFSGVPTCARLSTVTRPITPSLTRVNPWPH